MDIKYWKKKVVLVTGHEGFLGSNLVKRLVSIGSEVIGIDCVSKRKVSVLSGLRGKFEGIKGDIADFRFLRKVIISKRPNIIFHLAAEAIVGKAKGDPLRTLRSNIEGTWNVLESSRSRKNIESIVVASSDKAYGSSPKLPYTESTPLNGLHVYDASKSCTDILARSYYNTYDVPVSVVRCGNIYGPGDHNFSRLIPDAIRCAIKGKRFYIRSDGTFTRDYIYVDDVVAGYILIAEGAKKLRLYGEAFNLSCENPLSVLQVYKKVKKNFSKKAKPPKILNSAGDEIHDQYLSFKRAKKVLGWRPLHTFEEGLKKTISWYQDNSGKF